MNKIYDCLIIGCGPCGIGAAIELVENGFDIAIIEKSMPGGKVNIAPRVDNYPGFQKIPGPDLAFALFQRMQDSHVPLIGDEVLSINKNDEIFVITCSYATYQAKTVLVASGTKEKKIGLKGEDEMLGHGLSYCALCDGHFYKDKVVAVIGGGNAALKEAIHLSKIVKHLYLIHRRIEFRASLPLIKELNSIGNVTILTPYIPSEIIYDTNIRGLKIEKSDTHEDKFIDIDGLFPLVGQIPNTSFLKDYDVLDENGNIPVNKQYMSRVDGLFAGGDVLPRQIRQIYLAEHDGKMASKSIISYLKGELL